MIALTSPYVAVLDTCVLAPRPLCDTLLRLAEEPAVYVPKWSDDILRELRATLAKMSCTPAQAERRIAAMEAAFEDARVTGYEDLIGSMTNEPKDRHVLAAAVRCGAHAIVTENAKHFSPESRAPYHVDLLTPDGFLIRQFHLNQELLVEKLQDQAAARQIPLAALLTVLGKRAPKFGRQVCGSL